MARIIKGAGLLALVLLVAFIGVWGAHDRDRDRDRQVHFTSRG